MNVLEGIRVLDLSQNMAGPYCTQILGDLGADVLKIEPPGGDPARDWGPPFWGDTGALFMSTNRNKRSAVLDLKTREGRETLWTLVEQADVFVQTLRPGAIERLGFSEHAVRERRPEVVYVSVSAYGDSGPGSDLAGYDPLIQAYSGLMANTGAPDGPPARAGASVIDLGTGMWGAVGVLAALRRRDQTGEGSHVQLALLDTALGFMSYHLTGYLASGVSPERCGTSLALICPYQAFPTSDGELMIAGANDGIFRRLCAALDLDELGSDARFADNPSRVRHCGVLVSALTERTSGHSTAALFALLREHGVPCAPIHTIPEVVQDGQVKATGMLRSVPLEGVEGYVDTAMPVRWDGARPEPGATPPGIAEHGPRFETD